MAKIKRLIIMAGGTGGHIFPGLVIAHYLIAHGWQVRWLGTVDHMEATIVPQQGINIDFICIKGLRGKSIKMQLITLIHFCRAFLQARRIMYSWQPSVVLGMGGYVSGPGGLAAWSYGIPMVLHEQNSVAGLTNRLLAKIACKTLQAFPGALPKANIVGNPVRYALLTLPAPEIRFLKRTGPIRILVIGGSQGAQVLNKVIPEVATLLSSNVLIWHQVGHGALDAVKLAYAITSEIQQRHKVVEFIEDMASAYAWADVVISRAGALTVSEIAAIGLPALFVPFMHKDRQQYWNGRILEQIGAAKIIEESAFTAERVSKLLASWDRPTLLIMAQRAIKAAVIDATEKIAQEIESLSV